eukprot:GHVS01045054.1.p1 GENE.GHVS01045054.1~~GHVS01045054.1.p1  ORF type:complete len:217 (+),score=12.79 GHVS01045054.1:124-774(+)
METFALQPLLRNGPALGLQPLLPLYPPPSYRHSYSPAPFQSPPLNATTLLRPSVVPLCSLPSTQSYTCYNSCGKLRGHSFKENAFPMIWKPSPGPVDSSLTGPDYLTHGAPDVRVPSPLRHAAHLPPLLPRPLNSLVCVPPWSPAGGQEAGHTLLPPPHISTRHDVAALLPFPSSPHRWNDAPLLPLPSPCGQLSSRRLPPDRPFVWNRRVPSRVS